MTQKGDLFGYILDLTGGVSASIAAFIVPALAYLEATKDFKSEEGLGLEAGNSIGTNDKYINSNNNHNNVKQNSDKQNIAAYRMGCWILVLFGVAVMIMVPMAVVLSAVHKR